jgi:multidrug efflux pump subunit AcrB
MTDPVPKRPSLNAAGRLARAFLHSKLTPLMMVAVTLFGALAILFTPRTYNPEIVVPVVNIQVSRPGSDAREMLNQVVRPLETLLSSLHGVDHTYGVARDDTALVTVRFNVGEDEERSLVKVYNQVNGNMDRIPPGTQPPLIRALSLYDVPIVTVTLSADDKSPQSLRDIGLHVLEQLRAVQGVGKTWIQGAAPRAVKVALDPARLGAYGLSLDQVARALADNNVTDAAGALVTGNREHPLRVSAALTDPDEVRHIMVGTHEDRPVFLSDVADISQGPVDEDMGSVIAYGPADPAARTPGVDHNAVTLTIARKKGTNGVAVADAVLTRLHAIEHAALPQGVTATVTRDDGATADDAVNTLIEHLGISILAVVVILLLFLGWREASVVTLSIPLILFVVLGVGWMFGQTINRITLFALILSLGLLVDDSIVVIENIHRHLHRFRQRNLGRLIVAAADEIGRPTIIATFTVILALIPMAFVTGMMGPFMGPIPFNAPIAMITSLIMAYTVVPYLAYRWLRRKARRVMEEARAPTLEERGESRGDWLHRTYTAAFRPLLEAPRRRNLFMAGVGGLLVLVMLQPLWQFIRPGGVNGPLSPLGVELKMLPDDNVNTLLIEIDTPAGTPREQTGAVAQAVGAVLAKNPYITDYQSFTGEAAPQDFAAMVRGDAVHSGPDFAQIRVNLINKHARGIGSHAITQQIYTDLAWVRAAFPNTRIKLLETPPGPPVESQMMAALYGPDYPTLRRLAEDIRHHQYADTYGMINVDDSVGDNVTEYRVVVDRTAAAAMGLTPAQISATVQSYFAGRSVGTIHEPGAREPVEIILRLPATARTDTHVLDQIYLTNSDGHRIALDTVARLTPVIADKPFYTRDQYPVVFLTGNMLHSSPVFGVVSLTGLLSGMPTPDGGRLRVGNLGFVPAQPDDLTGYSLGWLGEMRLTLDVFRDLGAAFIVALLLIYLLLVGYYRSFLTPLVVMGAIPLVVVGVFPGHWLMHQPFTATSMIGVIALAGIVVRNSLLLIDFIVERRKAGHGLAAAVLEAGAVRLRPILLTALAIILGSAVMLTDPVFGGLAISLIFGAFASTVLTLFVIPLIYYLWQRGRAT